MDRVVLKRWQFVHRWSSLVSTAFLLMLCLTGLPLVFHQEIERAMQPSLADPLPRPPALARLVERAVDGGERRVVQQLYFLPDRRLVQIETGAPGEFDGPSARHVLVDMATGRVVPEAVGSPVLDFIRDLHVDMLAGLAGSLFLGAMGLLLLVAIVSGVAIYGPFTRKLPFGTLRAGRRARWLDLHNLLGIVTLAWLGAVGLTGAINTLSGPVAQHWQQTDLAAMAAPFMQGEPPARLAPVSGVIAAAQAAAPGMWVTGVYYPGSPYATPRHYGVYLRGGTPVTARLLTPMLVDARTGRIDAIGQMPWHVNVLLLSQPLHFGDYGGLPLKLLWAMLDIASIVVLATGLVLFVRRGRAGAKTGTEPGRQEIRRAGGAALTVRQQWTLPLAIALASGGGLVLALLSPAGPGRWLSWLLVAAPLAGIAVARARLRR
ncbi:MAG TPA: PepSY-associated TM helix domain-containing protein [Novosphingobium sp.]|nr:PepSY-associated TM helix domain-containing protein [Novosphingobium sp.]